MHRLAVIFQGRVQGVGFRYTTREVAQGFAVTGWVRNEPDGSVRLEAQGDPAEVAAMVGALERRMAGYISGRQSIPITAEPAEEGFEIRR